MKYKYDAKLLIYPDLPTSHQNHFISQEVRRIGKKCNIDTRVVTIINDEP